MKIVHVVDSLDVGGAETLVVQLCRLHREAGHSPEVHCLFRGGALAETLERAGITVHVHGRRSTWQLLWSCHREFRSRRPDVVHCHNAMATIAAAPAAGLAGVRAILSTRHGLVPPPYSRSREWKFWLAASWCHHVVAVCDAARLNLERSPGARPAKLVTIRNGALPAPVSGVPSPVAKQGFTVINVARLVADKDHRTLIEAAALARPRVPDLQVWIVGGGVLEDRIRQRIAELDAGAYVHLLGERKDVGDLLAAADVFALSSASEGLPVSLLEAMAAALPCIVTAVGGMPEIIALSRAGTVVPPGDPAKLADAVVHYAERPNGRGEIGLCGRACYEEMLTAGRMAESYLRLYER